MSRAPLTRLFSRLLLTCVVATGAACTGIVDTNPGDREPEAGGPDDNGPRLGLRPTPGADPSSATPQRQSLDVSGGGSAVDVDTGVCGADLAEDTFRYALCVCGDLDMAGSLSSSSMRDGTIDLAAGGVGVNGSYSTAGSSDIGGSLIVGGDFSPVGSQRVATELRVGGDMDGVGSINIEQDAFIAGGVDAIGLDVGGTLYTTEEVSMFFISAGDTEVVQFDIPPPCGCDSADDVDAFIATAATDNDNAALGIDADALANVVGNETLDVGPGRVFLTGIDLAGGITFRVHGATAVYIDGDIDAAGQIDVELADANAELNLFVGGDISTAGQLELGTNDDPTRVRVYMSGDGDIDLAGGIAIRGGLSAPNSILNTAGGVILEGSIVVGGINAAGSVDVRYDTGFIDTESNCDDIDDSPEPATPAPEAQPEPAPEAQPEPAPEAQPEPAVNDDGEAICATSLDCPEPQVCLDGVCGFLAL